MERERGLKETVVSVTGRDGAVYALVVHNDDSYGITRDGRPAVTKCPDTLKACLVTLQQLAGVDAHDG